MNPPRRQPHLPPKYIIERYRERFLSRFIPVTETGCWLWEGCRDSHGYGYFYVKDETAKGKDRVYKAHRISWVLHNGDITNGLHVLHKCDTPSCINPHHLFLGTPRDNVNDMIAKKRKPIGESHASSKLTLEQVVDIKRNGGRMGLKALALKHGVSPRAVGRIIRGERWAHVTMPD